MLTSDDLVTGEAVALDLPPAGLAIRIASGLIDLVVALVLLIVLALIFGIATTNVDGAIATIAVISSASPFGTFSATTEKAPASATAFASLTRRARLSPRPCTL